MFSIMLFIFLCFFGILAVLHHMLRSQERMQAQLRDELAELRALFRAIGSSPGEPGTVREPLSAHSRPAASTAGSRDPEPAGAETALDGRCPADNPPPEEDPLLRLSFDPPAGGAGGQSAGRAAQAVDPALDLHFDPSEMGAHTAARPADRR